MNDQLKLLYEKYWDEFITNVYKATMKDGKTTKRKKVYYPAVIRHS